MSGAPPRDAAGASTTFDRAVGRLRDAALEAAGVELGGPVTDWKATFEGPSQVVLKAWSHDRFGTFAASLDPAGGTVAVECYGARSFKHAAPQDAEMPQPLTGAQEEAVAQALDQWLATADSDDNGGLAKREQVRAFRASLSQRSVAAETARRNAEDLLVLLSDPDADEQQLRRLADEVAGFVHPRARRRFSRH